MGNSNSNVDMFQEESQLHSLLVSNYNKYKTEAFSENLPQLRFICRARGIPSQLGRPLLSFISSPAANLKDKILGAQTLRYAFEHKPNFLPFPEILQLLKLNLQQDTNNHKFQTEICLIICKHFPSQNSPKFIGCIQNILASKTVDLSAENRSEFGRHLENYKLEIASKGISSQDLNQQQSNPNYQPCFATKGGLSKILPKNGGKEVKANAAKVQQQSTSKTQENSSEQTNLAQINLAKALNARSKSIKHDFRREILPSKEESKTGSDTCWYRTTYYEVLALYELAKGEKTISNDDQIYLFNKLSYGHYFTFEYENIYNMIAESYYYISKRQRLNKEHLAKLLQELGKGEKFDGFVLQTVQRAAARDSSYFTQNVQDKLKSFMKNDSCKQNHRDIIFDTFAQMSGTAEATNEIFEMAISKLGDVKLSDSAKETSLKYVSLQSLNENRVRALFTSTFIEKLCSISVNSEATTTAKTGILEILENYLDHNFTRSVSSSYLVSLLKLEDEERNASFQLAVTRVVIKSLNKKDGMNNKHDVLGKLAEMDFLEHKTKVMAIVALHDESKSIQIPNLAKLSPLLLENVKANLEDSEHEKESANYLSSLVASTLLNSWSLAWAKKKSCGQPPSTAISNLISAVEEHADIQTQIRCSKLLRGLAEFEILTVDELKSLNGFTSHQNPDIRLQSKCSITKGAFDISRQTNKQLDPELFTMALKHFNFDQQLLDGPDFSGIINQNVMDTIQREGGKFEVEFGSELWTVATEIFDATNILQMHVHQMLDSLIKYSKNRKEIPAYILSSIEHYLEDGNNFSQITETIFENLITFGSPVTRPVLGHFVRKLVTVDDTNQHQKLFAILSAANINQDLPESVFNILWMETCFNKLGEFYSSNILKSVTTYFTGKDERTKMELKNVYIALESCLEKKVNVCSKNGMETFAKASSTIDNPFLQNLLRCLGIVASKGQSIPNNVLEQLSQTLSKSNFSTCFQLLTSFCSSLLKNNQDIPKKLTEMIFQQFETTESEELLSFIFLWVERGHKISNKTVEKLIQLFYTNASNVGKKKDQLIASLFSTIALASDYIKENDSNLISVFFVPFEDETFQYLIPTAVDGLCAVLRRKQLKLNSNQTKLLIDSLHLLKAENYAVIISILRGDCPLSKEQMLRLTLADINQITSDSDFVNSLQFSIQSEKNFSSIIDKKCVARLLKILIKVEPAGQITVLGMISKILDQEGSNLEKFPLGRITENVVQTFVDAVQNSNNELQNYCSEVLKKKIFYTNNLFNAQQILEDLESVYPASKFIIASIPEKLLSSKTKFLIKLEKLQDINGTASEALLDEISRQMLDGFLLDKKSIFLLLDQCKSSPLLMDKALSILATLIIKDAIPLDSVSEHLFMEHILKREQIPPQIVLILKKLIESHGIKAELQTEIMSKLITIFRSTKNNYRLRKNILHCIAILANKYTNCRSDEALKLLELNLYSEDSNVRRIAFKGLKVCQDKLLKFISTTSENVLELKDVKNDSGAGKFFVKCKTGNLSSTEIKIFQTLASLNQVDYDIFESNQMDWEKQLVLLDFTLQLETTAAKVSVYDKLEELGNQQKWSEQFYDFVFWLREQCQENCLLETEITSLLNTLIPIEFEKLKSLKGLPYLDWKHRLQIWNLSISLEAKLESNVEGTIGKTILTLNKKLGFGLLQRILEKIKRVKNLTDFEKLSRFIYQYQNNPVNWNLIGICENEQELRLTIDKQMISELLKNKTQLTKSDLIRCQLQLNGLQSEGNFTFEALLNLLNIQDGFEPRESEAFAQVLRLLYDYSNKLSSEFVPKLTKMLQNFDWKDWVLETNKLITKSSFRIGSTLKSPEEVVANLIESKSKAYKEEMVEIVKKIQMGDFTSIYTNILKNISTWEKSEISTWAKEIKARFANQKSKEMKIDSEFCIESLAVCKRAFYLHSNFHLTPVQIVSIYSGINKGLKGALFQIATGSGKSTIVAILAVVNGLRNLTIDLYTSSPVLAERDARSWAPFYSMFSLSVAHNADSGVYISGLKSCYTKDVVYGEISQFQFDLLRHNYSDLGTMGERIPQFAIVDEVDSLLVDDLSKLARLSSPFPGSDLLQILYHLIYHRMVTVEKKLFSLKTSIYFVDGQIVEEGGISQLIWTDNKTGTNMCIDDLVGYIQNGEGLDKAGITKVCDIDKFIKDHLENYILSIIGKGKPASPPTIKIPKHLQSFVLSQIPKWIDNCILAYNYQEDVHYIVDEGQIKPVDYLTTGIVQNSTSWSDGLHQFLQLKHNLPLTSETCTTNFLSNMSLFQMYNKEFITGVDGVGFWTSNIVGLTGTLGSYETRAALEQLYNCKSTNIPLAHHQRYIQYPDIMVSTEDAWSCEIVAGVKAQIARKRGTLIICETIQDVHKVAKSIKTFCPMNNGIRLYTHNNCDQEKQIEKIYPGQIIIATNLAGRGTDINTKEIEEFGGLHVCLTFLPNNVRVEEQAFGRTSRQGNFGSGQLIATTPIELLLSAKNPKFVKEARNAKEGSQLENFLKDGLILLKAKDNCFNRFCSLLAEVRQIFWKEGNVLQDKAKDIANAATETLFGGKIFADSQYSSLNAKPLNVLQLNQLQALEERWALFLRQVDDGIIDPNVALEYYSFFEWKLRRDFCLKIGADHSNVIKSPFYHIGIGNDYILKTSSNDQLLAKRHFESAIRQDPDFCSAALVGLGALYLKDPSQKNYKSKAIKYLKKALTLLQEEMSNLSTAQSLLRTRNSNEESGSLLEKQLVVKMNILGSYANSVEANLNVTKQSLRPVTIIASKSKSKDANENNYFASEFSDDVKSTTAAKLVQLSELWDTFSLKFEHLTVSEDSGAVDQAIDTIKKTGENALIECENVTFENLMKLISEDVYVNDLSAEEALIVVEGWIAKGPNSVSKFIGWSSDNVRVDVYETSGNQDEKNEKAKTENKKKVGNSQKNSRYKNSKRKGNENEKSIGNYDEELEEEEAEEEVKVSDEDEVEVMKNQSDNKDDGQQKIEKMASNLKLQDSLEYFKNLKNKKFYNLVAKKANANNYDVFNSQKFDLEMFNLSPTEAASVLFSVNKTELTFIKIFNCKILPNITESESTLSTIILDNNNGCSNSFSGWREKEQNLNTSSQIIYQMSNNSSKNFRRTVSSLINGLDSECQICLKFTSVIHEEIKNNLTFFQQAYKGGNVTIHKPSFRASSSEKVIAKLREMGIEFCIIFPSLSLDKAQNILSKSSLEQEDMEFKEVKLLHELFMTGESPTLELGECMARGIFLMFSFNEKRFVPWFSIACIGGLAAIQMAVGGILVATGFGATVGMSLITEGAADVFTAYRAYSNRQFSWGDYATQKAVSLVISAVSMGLSSLKDAAKGTTLLVESAGKEIVEQAGTKLITEGGKRTLNVTIKVAGDNLKKLAVKKIGVSLGEAGLREAGNYGMDQISKFAMSSIQPQINDKVETEVSQSFYRIEELTRITRLMYCLNKKQLETRILFALSEVTKGSVWAKYWQSVGLPLVRGVFSNSRYFLANVLAHAARVATMLNGIREIVMAIEKVCLAILANLKKIDVSPAKLLHQFCNLGSNDAIELAPAITVSIVDNVTIYKLGATSWGSSQQKSEVNSYFENLNKRQKSFKMTEVSYILQQIVDGLTVHIIRITESQLVAPVSSWAVGQAVSSVSALIQENFIVDQTQSAEGEPGQKTVSDQINANAKQFTIAWTQRENFAEVMEAIRSQSAGGQSLKEIPESVQKTAIGILFDNAPADATTLIALGEKLGLNLRIVPPNYIPTKEDLETGVKLVIFQPGEKDESGVVGIGHYDAMDPDSGEIVRVAPEGVDNCGYDIISYFTDFKVDTEDLRKEAAELILTHPKTFEKVLHRTVWMETRYPYESAKHLLKGGRVGDKLIDLNLTENSDLENQIVRLPKVRFIGKEEKISEDGLVVEEKFTIEIDSDLPSGTKTNKKVQKFTRAKRGEFPGIKRLCSGHLVHEKLGGSGTDSLNIMEMTYSLNQIYRNSFEKHCIDLKGIPNEKFTILYEPVIRAEYGLLTSIEINVSLVGASDLVLATFRDKFSNYVDPTSKKKIYTGNATETANCTRFSTTLYHNANGLATRLVPDDSNKAVPKNNGQGNN